MIHGENQVDTRALVENYRGIQARGTPDLAKTHGMPGLAGLREARVEALPTGAEICSPTGIPALIGAIHKWFNSRRTNPCAVLLPGFNPPNAPSIATKNS
ncbi:MAG: hypothetical protein CTY16_15745 [Methylobacter sp.]|nr:MAG: hypothetical protein CTY16_15745 [Methylobacter sp.]